MNRASSTALRLLGGLAVLGVLVWKLGSGPFVAGFRTVDGQTLLAGVALAVPTTVCCAWRWQVVARHIGLEISLPAAVAAYYRSQFLNTALPGGVLGDLHRGLRQGRHSGRPARGLRSVVYERVAGQVVQVVVALTVLLVLPSPVSRVLVAGALVLLLIGLVAVRRGVLPARTWPRVGTASVLAMAGPLATFLVAAHSAGVKASAVHLVPLALLVLVAMAVPLNIAGWGPREGVAAWAFGAVGLGASVGVTTAVVYGVMVLVAALPGAVVLMVGWLRNGAPHVVVPPARPLVTAGVGGAGD